MCIRDRDKQYIVSNNFPQTNPHFVYVFLDEDEIFYDSSLTPNLSAPPFFNGFFESVKSTYHKLNPNPSRNTFKFTTTTKSDSKKNTGSKKSSQKTTGPRRSLCFKPTQEEEDIAREILRQFRDSNYKNIIRIIPKEPVFDDNNPQMLNYNLIEKNMVDKTIDKNFTSRFVRTLIFTYFLEEHYELVLQYPRVSFIFVNAFLILCAFMFFFINDLLLLVLHLHHLPASALSCILCWNLQGEMYVMQQFTIASPLRSVFSLFFTQPPQPNLLTVRFYTCLLYTSPSPRDGLLSRMPSSA
eukprot:TRINITY_DN12711_c0_g1_i3.p1 TRINITY_DN12711_c0_g1~~TRINITY_DN12711_c0_g1_i3.p1  ORF type:complete len:298 (+),score=39.08 TRINITY_DN12711_c0_g1_i3:65-958(+)